MQKRLIIDSNLLLLLVIGAVEGGRHIRKSNRLSKFNRDDFDSITRVMREYDDVCITPYIAAEVSNLIDLNGHARTLAYQIARNLFNGFNTVDVDIKKDCESECFLRYGITDSSLIKLAPDYYILTNDLRMMEALFASSPETIIPYVPIKANS